MKSSIITNYSTWKNANEAANPGRTKQTAGMGQKVVGIPINEQSFKIKIVGDLDVIDSAGRLTPQGWPAIFNWIKQQPKWLPYYPALGDLKNNFVIYSINRDTDRKQVITFTISPRTSAPGLPENIQVVSQGDLKTVLSDPAKASQLANMSASAVNTQVSTAVSSPASSGKVVISTPIPFNNLGTLASTNPPLFKLIDDLVAHLSTKKLFVDPTALSLLNDSADELEANRIGEKTTLLLKGLIAGLGANTYVDKYGRTKQQTSITQEVADKLATLLPSEVSAQNSSFNYYLGLGATALYEQTIISDDKIYDQGETEETTITAQRSSAGLPSNFNIAAFLEVIGANKTSTQALGDIKLPEGGMKKSTTAKGDSELKKFQQLVIDKFAKKLGNNELYKKFAKFGTDGDYGPTTEKMVASLKAALGCSDKDGTTITAELITKINTNKIDESIYLGLGGMLVEQFDMGAFEETAKRPSSGGGSAKAKAEEKKEESQPKASGDAQKASDLLKAASQAIEDYYEDESNFKEFKGFWNDDEEGAVAEIFGKNYDDKTSWFYRVIRKKYLGSAWNIIKSLPDEDDNKSLLTKELKKVQGLYGILKKKTLGSTGDDSYKWAHIDLENKKTQFEVNTDF